MIKKALLGRLSRKKRTGGEPVSYDKAHAVGLISLYESDGICNELINELKIEGKNPHWICMVPKPDKNQEYPEEAFSAKDISMTGRVLSNNLKAFIKQKYDYLICLDTTGNRFIKYIVSRTSAHHRVGLYHSEYENLLDMMVKSDGTVNDFQELMKYLKLIRHD